MTRLGYQISVRIVAHQANMLGGEPQPVMVLTEVLEGDVMGWTRDVYQVRLTGPSRSEYGWGEERAHARGRRFDTHVWIYTEHPVEYRTATGWEIAP